VKCWGRYLPQKKDLPLGSHWRARRAHTQVTTTYGNKPSAERLVMTEILMDNAAAFLGEDEEPLMDEREHLVPLLYSIVHK
jgi:hypothetical protein